MWCSDRRAFVLAVALLAGGCGFQPLYAPGTPAANMIGTIAVAPIAGDEPAFLMRERLTERLGAAELADYRLEVTLKLTRRGVALTQQDYTTRYNITGVADYRLVALAGGPPVRTGRVESFTGYSAPESETASAFASRVAEQDAELRLAATLADRIVMELAITADDRALPAPAP